MTPRRPLPARVIAALLAAACCGCADQAAIDPAAAERDEALEEARKLRRELEHVRARLAKREEQVENLLALGDKRLEKLYVVQRVRLGSATGGIDLDKRPGHDGVKVFLEPIDQHGSVIKVPGEVRIQLFELAAPEKENLLAEYRFGLDETAKHWSSGFLAYHYSFVCRWKSAPPRHEGVTVRAEFLDYLTGNKHTAQKLCKVALPPRPATQPAAK
jgi:hypothetical protein